jgi:hypothetical protein
MGRVATRLPAFFFEENAMDESIGNQRKADPKLLEMLVCPLTKTTLRYDASKNELISEKAKLAFPIREGVPLMLVDEARRLD